MLKPYLAASPDVGFHPKAGKSDSEERLLGGELPHQIDTVAIGQGEVADKHVELLLFADVEGGLKSECRLHVITAPYQQIRKGTVGIFVIFDQQNPHGLAVREPWRQRRSNLCLNPFACG